MSEKRNIAVAGYANNTITTHTHTHTHTHTSHDVSVFKNENDLVVHATHTMRT